MVYKVEFTPKHLHAKEREDYNEEKKKEEQGGDGADRVEERGHKVTQRGPVPAKQLREEVLINYTTSVKLNAAQSSEVRVLQDLLCDFEDPQQPDTPEYWETQGSHGPCRQHDHLQDTTQHHKEVETVEKRHEICSGSQSIDLHKHLYDKQHQ